MTATTRSARTRVAETTFVIKHRDAYYIRTGKGVRLSGGGIGAVFEETDIVVRDKLE